MKSRMMRSVLTLVICCLFCVNMSYADVGKESQATDDLMKLVKDLQKEVQGLNQEIASLQAAAKKDDGTKALEDKIAQLQGDVKTLRAQKGAAPQVVTAQGADVPSWLNGTEFGGDMMVRFQMDSHSGSDLDRMRGRLRLRYGIAKQVNDELKAGFVLATGSNSISETDGTVGDHSHDISGNRRSSIASMGADDSGFDKLNAWIDQAYLKYQPYFLNDIEGLTTTLWGGKFKENWKHKGILIHPEAVGFDGFGQSFTYEVADGLNADFNMAELFISEGAGEDADSEMYVFDLGIKGAEEGFTWGLRSTAYLFAGYNDGGAGALGGYGDYRTVVGTADLGFDLGDMPVAMFAQFGKNLNDESLAGVPSSSPGGDKYWAAGVTVNKIKEVGDWNAGYKFAYLESNVIPSGLPDADLVGGREAHWLYANYRLFNSTDLNITVILPRTIDGDGETDSMLTKLNWITRF